MTTAPLVIVGAGGFGREAADVAVASNSASDGVLWNLKGVFDDAPSGSNIARLQDRGIPYLGRIPAEWDGADINFIIGIGSPSIRQKLADRLERLRWKPAILVHPSAVIGSQVHLGLGTVVCGGAQISTNVRFGCHVHLNSNVTIGHDVVLDDYVSINPAATVSGDVHVETGTLIGAAATILQGLHVGSGSVVGASACVVRNVRSGAVVKGVPAR